LDRLVFFWDTADLKTVLKRIKKKEVDRYWIFGFSTLNLLAFSGFGWD
jgi:hypothetical protein